MRISIRDLFWFTLLAAVLVAWWVDRSRLASEIERAVTVSVLGAVVKTDDAQQLIEVSMGIDDGVRVSDRLEVSRGNRWLGFAVVQKVAYDTSVARVESIKGVIQEGDVVRFTFDTRRLPESAGNGENIVDRRHP
jgi:hypothetical protein